MVLTGTFLTAVAALAMSTSPGIRPATPPRIVAFGDSLTSGHGIGTAQAFPAVLQERLRDAGYTVQMVNAGVSGDTTGRALQRLHDALLGDVRIVILALGVNDGLRGVPVAQVRTNLARIIEAARARGIAVLLCGMEALPVYGWSYSVAFHQAYLDLARQYDLTLVPFLMLRVLGNQALMLPDRVHPNAAGARVIADHVWPYLDALLVRSGYSRSAT
ncbi:MAG: arylesterase [Vicinamibacterales bacterium]